MFVLQNCTSNTWATKNEPLNHKTLPPEEPSSIRSHVFCGIGHVNFRQGQKVSCTRACFTRLAETNLKSNSRPYHHVSKSHHMVGYELQLAVDMLIQRAGHLSVQCQGTLLLINLPLNSSCRLNNYSQR